ncbi:hypothetical protein OIU83_19085 [Flavobacterium sp. LS1R49]|uniref:Uncharacterized protein n=1 Tax=Flavobacterium shii TaxID=2987687 RepID=A0A9X3C548_9FLAO|nr:hypothetical protein [Flavobacterium shii]MCV9929774.1 hypothetical protein [Flavobacterium shii]
MNSQIKIWEDQVIPGFNDSLVIHFKIPTWNDELENTVSLTIFWKKNKQDSYKPKEIFVSSPCYIQHTFQNGITINGNLDIKNFSYFNSTDTLGIFGDIYYYINENENYIWHTAGFLISFNPKPANIDDEKTHIIDESILNKLKTAAAVNPMAVSDSEHAWSFFYYKPFLKKSPDFSFPAKLVSLKAKGQRELMQNEALDFIDGIVPYNLQYVFNVNELYGDIGKFKLFYDFLYKGKILTHIIEQTCVFFDTSVKDFLIYLESDSYLENKQRLWETYFALIITMGYDNENRTAIMKVMMLCNFLEKVFDHLDDAQFTTTLDKTKLFSLFNASIVLNEEIFPLPAKSSMSIN